jgi:radical SAM/Cys-rich protein
MALATTSLIRRGSELSNVGVQRQLLQQDAAVLSLPQFDEQLMHSGIGELRPLSPSILQINLGKMCNQACKHCHVDAGPDRTEIMSREIMQQCLDALDASNISTVDLTGGAPEMNPEFRWFVEQLSARGVMVMVRCNLTIIVANPKYHDLPQFYAEHGVHVVSSLPFYDATYTDRQRGGGVFHDSIRALKMLNDVGYGIENSGLLIDLVYNPVGALLPGPQASLEKEFKRNLSDKHNVVFNNLHCITNMPISRFLEFLVNSGNYERYMRTLVDAFNPAAAHGVMCRTTISVGYDGRLYDCDFNQMLEMPVASRVKHIAEFDEAQITSRMIATDRHCFGCTAGSGSSCGGQLA